MKINTNNMTLPELKAVIRTCDIIQERGAKMYLSEEQIQSIVNRIKQLEESQWVKKHLKDTALMFTVMK